MTEFLRQRKRWDGDTEAVLMELILHGWTNSTEAFFQYGQEAVDAHLNRAKDFGLPKRRKRALDFGCGMGRLTRALADRFESVVGLDISPVMLERAKAHDLRPDYRLMEDFALPDLEPVDFLLSVVTVQHVPGPIAAGYMKTFPTLLAKGGIGSVQVTHPVDTGDLTSENVRELLGSSLLDVDLERVDERFESAVYWFS